MRHQLIKSALALLLFGFWNGTSFANDFDQNQIQLQQQRQAQLQEKIIPNPSVFSQPTLHQTTTENKTDIEPNKNQNNIDKANNCFQINTIQFTTLIPTPSKDVYRFQFAIQPELDNKKVIGQCLNLHDIEQLVSRVQNRIIERGYATTRVLIGNQNLSSGRLVLTLVVGYIDQIHANTKNSKRAVYVSKTPSLNQQRDIPATFGNALPLKSGKILNIRDLETGLENLKRVSYVDANFDIQPSSAKQLAGYSDILIDYTAQRRVLANFNMDDSGSKYTGKHQGTVTLSFLNPSQHNDLLYLTYGQDLRKLFQNNEPVDGERGSKSWSIGYVVPINRWLFNLSSSSYDYHQTVSGINQDYEYSGTSEQHSLIAQYLIHRNANAKTYLTAGGFSKEQKNFIDDTEVDVQRRKVAGWTAGIKHERQIKQTRLNADLTLQRGTGALDAITPAESLFNEGFIRTSLFKANLQLTKPFNIKQQQLSYQFNLKGQYANKPLVPSERFSIGGRYSVRGFDGERTLSGDIGASLRQELAWTLPKASQNNAHQLYAGLDAGWVKMKHKEQEQLLSGHHLIGSAIGLKGQYKKLNYDVFTSYPIYQPNYFHYDSNKQKQIKDWVSGFSVGLSLIHI